MKCFPSQRSVCLLNLVSKNHKNAFGLIQLLIFIQIHCHILSLALPVWFLGVFFKAHIVVELFDSSDIVCIDGKDYRQGVWASKPGRE